MKNTMKKLIAALCAVAMMFALCACSSAPAESAAPAPAENEQKVYKVGICNYVDDASLNQIVDNIRAGLDGIGQAQGVTFEIEYDNSNPSFPKTEKFLSGSEGVFAFLISIG